MKIPAYSKLLTMQNFLNLSGIKLCINGYDMLLGNRIDTFAEQNCGSHDFCAYDKIEACVLTEYDTILYHTQVEKPLHLYTVQELVLGVGIPKEGYRFEVAGTLKQDWIDLGTKKGVHEIQWRYSIRGVSLHISQYSDKIDIRIGVAKNGCTEIPEELEAKVESNVKSADAVIMEHAKSTFNRICESKVKAHKYIRQMALLELTDIKAARQLQEQRDRSFNIRIKQSEELYRQKKEAEQKLKEENEKYLEQQKQEAKQKQEKLRSNTERKEKAEPTKLKVDPVGWFERIGYTPVGDPRDNFKRQL